MTTVVSLRQVRDEFLNRPRHESALLMTAIFFAVRAFEGHMGEFHNVLITTLCILMLLSPLLLLSRWTWFAVFGAMAWVLMENWQTIDNHKYLMTYWALACALCVSVRNSEEVLSWNGRILIGLAFAFAAVWKILPGEFLDGSFFHGLFLTDGRFYGFSMLAGGLDGEVIKENFGLMKRLLSSPGAKAAVVLSSSPRLEFIAWVASYWVLLVEGSIAIAFLIPFRMPGVETVRHLILMLFVCTTYVLAPVDRFPSLFSILGFAYCPTAHKRLRTSYLLIFLVMQFVRFVPAVNYALVEYFTLAGI